MKLEIVSEGDRVSVLLLTNAGCAALPAPLRLTSPGTTVVVWPVGAERALVECWGPGANGGRAEGLTGGGGGGGGAYASAVLTRPAGGSTTAVIDVPNDYTPSDYKYAFAGPTAVAADAQVRAPGGYLEFGGQDFGATSLPPVGTTVNLGGAGDNEGFALGGGGSSAGPLAAGVNGSGNTGGTAPAGGGDGGNAAAAGSAPGGGAGGSTSSFAQNNGAGGAGKIVFNWLE